MLLLVDKSLFKSEKHIERITSELLHVRFENAQIAHLNILKNRTLMIGQEIGRQDYRKAKNPVETYYGLLQHHMDIKN